MSNLTTAQAAQQNNRTSDGKYTNKATGEAEVTLIDSGKLPAPENLDPAYRESFVQSFADSAQHLSQVEADDDESFDGDPFELELDAGNRKALEDAAGRFYDDNAGDLIAFADRTRQSMSDLGHDTFMESAGTGVGHRDRVAGSDQQAETLAQRLGTSIRNEIPSLEESDIGDDNQIHFPVNNPHHR